jgi:hypothetical protein
MGYWARIHQLTNKIDKVIIAEQDFIEQQPDYDFWVETFIDGSQRKNYAGKGFTYDSSKDAFIPPKPYASWTLNETTCRWEPPTAFPDDGSVYTWNEETTSWDLDN